MALKFIVKDMDIATGGAKIALIHQKDAQQLDLHHEDRVRLKKGRHETVAVVDIGESTKAVKPGHIGLFEETLDGLNAKHKDVVELFFEKKPVSVSYIRKKLDGQKLTKKEIFSIVQDIVDSELTDIELSYFVSACYMKKLDAEETKNLTTAMYETGQVLHLKQKNIFDKHCIGGICGNRTTMLIVPIVCSAGITMPKTSSRSITSPAGTADAMEVLADVNLPLIKMKKIVEKANGCITWGGALQLAPADDKIIRVEHPLDIDAEEQLLASILAKKKSVNANHLLIDIPAGKGAKIEARSEARKLKKEFETIAKKLGIKTKAIITNGSEPIGNGIGPALEARDALWILENNNKAPKDLREKALMMSGIILEMAGKAKKGKGKEFAEKILSAGLAYKKMKQIIELQGKRCTKSRQIKIGKITFDVAAHKNSRIRHIDNRTISKVARIAGAPVDKGAGIYLNKHVGDKVKKGEKIYTIYSESKVKIGFVKELVKKDSGVKIY